MKRKNRPFYEFWYSHPKLVTAFLLLAANVIITIIFTLILFLINYQDMTFIEAFQYCFLMGLCSDPIWSIRDTFNGNFDVYLIFHIIMTIIQMVTFSGSLIGFATTVLDGFFENMEENKKKLKLSNHFVFLNWNNLGPNIIYDLSFLEGKKTVVILADQDRDEVLNSINSIFTENKKKIKKLNIFVKSGDPANSRHLMDVSIDKAQSIGILLDSNWENEESDGELTTRDLNAFKLLMSIVHLVNDSNIVIESESKILNKKIEELFKQNPDKKNRITAFSHHEVIGHILGKGVLNKDYVDFYNEILSYEGVEFYGIDPLPLDEAMAIYNDFIPIVNYDDDDEIGEDGTKAADHLYILDEDGFLSKRKEPLTFDRRIKTHVSKLNHESHYLIVGDNDGLEFILEELDTYKKHNNELLDYQVFSYDELEEVTKVANNKTGDVKILLLSDNDENQDANIFINLLSLKLDYPLREDIPIYVEIDNPNNFTSIKNMGVAKTIVSNKMISLFMIQLMTHPQSKKFYLDILTPNENDEENASGIDFEICNAAKYLDVTEPIIFKSKAEALQVFYQSTEKKYLMIGYRKKDDNKINFLCSDMDKEEDIIIDKDTNIVVAIY